VLHKPPLGRIFPIRISVITLHIHKVAYHVQTHTSSCKLGQLVQELVIWVQIHPKSVMKADTWRFYFARKPLYIFLSQSCLHLLTQSILPSELPVVWRPCPTPATVFLAAPAAWHAISRGGGRAGQPGLLHRAFGLDGVWPGKLCSGSPRSATRCGTYVCPIYKQS
jgi:hypothetical protein